MKTRVATPPVASTAPVPVETGKPKRGCCGLFSRKERWGLSPRGWLLAIVVSGLVAVGLLLGIHPFLAVTDRADTDLLVMEGWVHQYAALATAREFEAGRYQRVFTTGGPVSGDGGYTGDANTSASVGAGLLRKAGLPDAVVQRVPSRVNGRDRTYHAALALRAWFAEQNVAAPALNVVTEAAHARRTRLLFQKAFGDGVKIGIISVPNPDYDAKHWWRYSEGVREVLGETIAYLYARILFHPDSSAR